MERAGTPRYPFPPSLVISTMTAVVEDSHSHMDLSRIVKITHRSKDLALCENASPAEVDAWVGKHADLMAASEGGSRLAQVVRASIGHVACMHAVDDLAAKYSASGSEWDHTPSTAAEAVRNSMNEFVAAVRGRRCGTLMQVGVLREVTEAFMSVLDAVLTENDEIAKEQSNVTGQPVNKEDLATLRGSAGDEDDESTQEDDDDDVIAVEAALDVYDEAAKQKDGDMTKPTYASLKSEDLTQDRRYYATTFSALEIKDVRVKHIADRVRESGLNSAVIVLLEAAEKFGQHTLTRQAAAVKALNALRGDDDHLQSNMEKAIIDLYRYGAGQRAMIMVKLYQAFRPETHPRQHELLQDFAKQYPAFTEEELLRFLRGDDGQLGLFNLAEDQLYTVISRKQKTKKVAAMDIKKKEKLCFGCGAKGHFQNDVDDNGKPVCPKSRRKGNYRRTKTKKRTKEVQKSDGHAMSLIKRIQNAKRDQSSNAKVTPVVVVGKAAEKSKKQRRDSKLNGFKHLTKADLGAIEAHALSGIPIDGIKNADSKKVNKLLTTTVRMADDYALSIAKLCDLLDFHPASVCGKVEDQRTASKESTQKINLDSGAATTVVMKKGIEDSKIDSETKLNLQGFQGKPEETTGTVWMGLEVNETKRQPSFRVKPISGHVHKSANENLFSMHDAVEGYGFSIEIAPGKLKVKTGTGRFVPASWVNGRLMLHAKLVALSDQEQERASKGNTAKRISSLRQEVVGNIDEDIDSIDDDDTVDTISTVKVNNVTVTTYTPSSAPDLPIKWFNWADYAVSEDERLSQSENPNSKDDGNDIQASKPSQDSIGQPGSRNQDSFQPQKLESNRKPVSGTVVGNKSLSKISFESTGQRNDSKIGILSQDIGNLNESVSDDVKAEAICDTKVENGITSTKTTSVGNNKSNWTDCLHRDNELDDFNSDNQAPDPVIIHRRSYADVCKKVFRQRTGCNDGKCIGKGESASTDGDGPTKIPCTAACIQNKIRIQKSRPGIARLLREKPEIEAILAECPEAEPHELKLLAQDPHEPLRNLWDESNQDERMVIVRECAKSLVWTHPDYGFIVRHPNIKQLIELYDGMPPELPDEDRQSTPPLYAKHGYLAKVWFKAGKRKRQKIMNNWRNRTIHKVQEELANDEVFRKSFDKECFRVDQDRQMVDRAITALQKSQRMFDLRRQLNYTADLLPGSRLGQPRSMPPVPPPTVPTPMANTNILEVASMSNSVAPYRKRSLDNPRHAMSIVGQPPQVNAAYQIVNNNYEGSDRGARQMPTLLPIDGYEYTDHWMRVQRYHNSRPQISNRNDSSSTRSYHEPLRRRHGRIRCDDDEVVNDYLDTLGPPRDYGREQPFDYDNQNGEQRHKRRRQNGIGKEFSCSTDGDGPPTPAYTDLDPQHAARWLQDQSVPTAARLTTTRPGSKTKVETWTLKQLHELCHASKQRMLLTLKAVEGVRIHDTKDNTWAQCIPCLQAKRTGMSKTRRKPVEKPRMLASVKPGPPTPIPTAGITREIELDQVFNRCLTDTFNWVKTTNIPMVAARGHSIRMHSIEDSYCFQSLFIDNKDIKLPGQYAQLKVWLVICDLLSTTVWIYPIRSKQDNVIAWRTFVTEYQLHKSWLPITCFHDNDGSMAAIARYNHKNGINDIGMPPGIGNHPAEQAVNRVIQNATAAYIQGKIPVKFFTLLGNATMMIDSYFACTAAGRHGKPAAELITGYKLYLPLMVAPGTICFCRPLPGEKNSETLAKGSIKYQRALLAKFIDWPDRRVPTTYRVLLYATNELRMTNQVVFLRGTYSLPDHTFAGQFDHVANAMDALLPLDDTPTSTEATVDMSLLPHIENEHVLSQGGNSSDHSTPENTDNDANNMSNSDSDDTPKSQSGTYANRPGTDNDDDVSVNSNDDCDLSGTNGRIKHVIGDPINPKNTGNIAFNGADTNPDMSSTDSSDDLELRSGTQNLTPKSNVRRTRSMTRKRNEQHSRHQESDEDDLDKLYDDQGRMREVAANRGRRHKTWQSIDGTARTYTKDVAIDHGDGTIEIFSGDEEYVETWSDDDVCEPKPSGNTAGHVRTKSDHEDQSSISENDDQANIEDLDLSAHKVSQVGMASRKVSAAKFDSNTLSMTRLICAMTALSAAAFGTESTHYDNCLPDEDLNARDFQQFCPNVGTKWINSADILKQIKTASKSNKLPRWYRRQVYNTIKRHLPTYVDADTGQFIGAIFDLEHGKDLNYQLFLGNPDTKEDVIASIDKEIKTLIANGCLRRINVGDSDYDIAVKLAVGGRCILDKKKSKQFKTRLVKQGVKGTEPFSPDRDSYTHLTTATAVRLTLSQKDSQYKDRVTAILDYSNAYTQADRWKPDEPKRYIRVRHPVTNEFLYFEELIPIYGGKYAGSNWENTHFEYLRKIGFKQGGNNPATFSLRDISDLSETPRKNPKDFVGTTKSDPRSRHRPDPDPEPFNSIPTDATGCVIHTYVDDCIIDGARETVNRVLRLLGGRFKIKRSQFLEEGTPLDFLGMTIYKKNGQVYIGMASFIRSSIKNLGLDNLRNYGSPLDRLIEMDAKANPKEANWFRRALGALGWAAMIGRPDVRLAFLRLGHHAASPCQDAIRTIKRVWGYLNSKQWLTLRANTGESGIKDHWEFFSDSDFSADDNPDQQRASTQGLIAICNGMPVLWRSGKATFATAISTVTPGHADTSVAASEIYAASEAINRFIALTLLGEDSLRQIQLPITLQVDNSSAIAFANGTVQRSKLIHVDCRQWWVQQLRDSDIVRTKHVSSKSNKADMFTKVLTPQPFMEQVSFIMHDLPENMHDRAISY